MPDNDMLFWRMLALFQCLPEIPPARIVAWLAGDSDNALTCAYLETLTQPRLAASFPPDPTLMSAARWSRVMACLRGDLPAHLRIRPRPQRQPQLLAAFCSQDGQVVNGHFGQGRLFFIYAIDDQGYGLHALRRYPSTPMTEEPNEIRARLVNDCPLLFCEAIGGPAAARLIRHDIHPMKVTPGTTIPSQCEAIRALLTGRLPPWLAKRLQRENPLRERIF
ncbi:NifB/NifX family molybdenum-iron cluster-binding protein [Martelella alba]|uniref:Nitrogen fixation protein NifY n=1 Tax=Martelella alba TaxID=2590451 RepID=A0ABY2SGE0_9HYPH|nr:NifB/NifX family molybdenum-iron cluster-binding protein [Martelella alba]TKI03475.1 nitrogen fixation protein NifY [Martelella alba]